MRTAESNSEHSRVADALGALARATPMMRWTTPVDSARHRAELIRRVIAGDRSPYDQPFRFPAVDIASARRAAEHAAATASELTGPLRSLVVSEVKDTLAHAEAVASRDDAMLAAWAATAAPQPCLIQLARQLVDAGMPPPERATITASRVADRLAAVLENYRLDDWSIEVTPDMAAKASVKHVTRQVRVRADAVFTEAGARRIVVHEIGGHVLRWVNAEAQPEPLAARPLGRTVPTEEGLAVLLEEQLGVSTPALVHTYALRVVAVDASQRCGLIDLAFALADIVAPEDAAELALRIRRGFCDPEWPGGLTKDAGYFEGLLACRALAASSPADLALLRGVKWPLEQVPLIRELAAGGNILTPALQPDPVLLGLN